MFKRAAIKTMIEMWSINVSSPDGPYSMLCVQAEDGHGYRFEEDVSRYEVQGSGFCVGWRVVFGKKCGLWLPLWDHQSTICGLGFCKVVAIENKGSMGHGCHYGVEAPPNPQGQGWRWCRVVTSYFGLIALTHSLMKQSRADLGFVSVGSEVDILSSSFPRWSELRNLGLWVSRLIHFRYEVEAECRLNCDLFSLTSSIVRVTLNIHVEYSFVDPIIYEATTVRVRVTFRDWDWGLTFCRRASICDERRITIEKMWLAWSKSWFSRAWVLNLWVGELDDIQKEFEVVVAILG